MQPAGEAREAAVLLALTRELAPKLVFIKRAKHLNQHGGEVAFPGGMWESSDRSLLHTALRESEEEVSLPQGAVEVVARMPRRSTRYGIPVTPYVGFISYDVDLRHEPGELDAVFRVPLEYLLARENLVSSEVDMKEGRYPMPCYQYKGFTIWGFTLIVLVQFLNRSLDAGLTLDYQREALPEALWDRLINEDDWS